MSSSRWRPTERARLRARLLKLSGALALAAGLCLTAGPTATAAESRQTKTETKEWNGKRGAENADPGCQQGQTARWHWILTPGGNNELQSAELTVTYESGVTDTDDGEFRGGDRGAMHFDLTRPAPDVVDSAEVTFTYIDRGPEGGNFVLTISDSGCIPGGEETPTPTPTPTDTATPSPTPTDTGSPSPTPTETGTPGPGDTETPAPGDTETPGPQPPGDEGEDEKETVAGALPFTGANAALWAALGLALLLGGAGIVWAVRRRGNASESNG